MPKKTTTVPVTMRALIQRINRKLRPDDEMLKVARGERARAQLGDYYAIDFNRNIVTAQHVDPEKWGREMNVLAPWEHVSDEE